MDDDSTHSVRVIANNPALDSLKRSWTTAKYSEDDGITPMGSLFEAGDALVAVARLDALGTTVLGSGIMIGPGLLLTATHVLDEFPHSGPGPAFLTFLPSGARAWLPHSSVTSSGTSAFDEDRKTVSDITLVNCTLNSEAHEQYPLTLAPLHVALPFIGDRLWAFGYRHAEIHDGAAAISPMVSSGLVTAVFPHGCGERMPSACIEVAMETMGGMSGGPVADSAGNVIGIVSSSFDGGPSYVTLIWEVLRLNIASALPWLVDQGDISLFGARDAGLVNLTGQVKRKRGRKDVVLTLSDDEFRHFVEASDPDTIAQRRAESTNLMDAKWIESFNEEWSNEFEDEAERAALSYLEMQTTKTAADYLEQLSIPRRCLTEIREFTVHDSHRLDYPDIDRVEKHGDDAVIVSFSFELPHLRWEITVPTSAYAADSAEFERHFLNVEVEGETTSMQAFQHCYFVAELIFDLEDEVFIATATGSRYWLGVVDVDYFKKVNDQFGHLVGDEVLLLLSRIMRGAFRFSDQLYRFGGEEFVVLALCNDEADAVLAFDRFRRVVGEYPFPEVGKHRQRRLHRDRARRHTRSGVRARRQRRVPREAQRERPSLQLPHDADAYRFGSH